MLTMVEKKQKGERMSLKLNDDTRVGERQAFGNQEPKRKKN